VVAQGGAAEEGGSLERRVGATLVVAQSGHKGRPYGSLSLGGCRLFRVGFYARQIELMVKGVEHQF
jgi:hypothetical protein